jgi:hypothetical protein
MDGDSGAPVSGVVKPSAKRDAETERLALEIATLRHNPVFIWSGLDRLIDYDCADDLKRQFSHLDNHRLSHLDVVLQSVGGDINAAYRCVRLLRRKANTVSVLVPYWTKSAATFITLSADEILMGEEAELGPLDAQVGDGAGSRMPLSALNESKALEAIRDFSVQTLAILTDIFETTYGMDLPYALDRAQAMTANFSSALYSQIPPKNLGQYARVLSVAEEYAVRVMSRWSYADRSSDEIKMIVRRLVYSYPAHDFNIDLDEAQAIGLKARPMDTKLDRLCWELVHREPLFRLVMEPVPDATSSAHGQTSSQADPSVVPQGGPADESA